MLESESLQLAIHETVKILPYDPAWLEKYELERQRLLALFPGKFTVIEHIGSTAVPGMDAKPVIDLMGGVRSMAEADLLLPLLCENGYTTSAEFNATLFDRRWLMRYAEGHRTHHLHLVIHESRGWHARIAFRDVLRANPDIALRYRELKTRLAGTMGPDREAYTSAKTKFIEETLHPR